jgi:hypothetical protein
LSRSTARRGISGPDPERRGDAGKQQMSAGSAAGERSRQIVKAIVLHRPVPMLNGATTVSCRWCVERW